MLLQINRFALVRRYPATGGYPVLCCGRCNLVLQADGPIFVKVGAKENIYYLLINKRI
jgi:hypothetical protein